MKVRKQARKEKRKKQYKIVTVSKIGSREARKD
jgi:hypothetical protein